MPAALRTATAVAPATVGNVAVGFDVLGHALAGPADRVTVRRIDRPGVFISHISGGDSGLPVDPHLNTAGRALLELTRVCDIDFGLEIEIDKGIPVGAGMGGSGASAVAAVVAANALLPRPLELAELLEFALAGEAAATGARVTDNVAPSLYGGLVLALPGDPVFVERVPAPEALRCVLVHPQLKVATRTARDMLAAQCPLPIAIAQASHLAGLIAGCYAGNLELIARSLEDVLIEPQRARLVPGFANVKTAALDAGALGCSLSGSGPSVFAWSRTADARAVAEAMTGAFAEQEIGANFFISPINAPGARCVVCSGA